MFMKYLYLKSDKLDCPYCKKQFKCRKIYNLTKKGNDLNCECGLSFCFQKVEGFKEADLYLANVYKKYLIYSPATGNYGVRHKRDKRYYCQNHIFDYGITTFIGVKGEFSKEFFDLVLDECWDMFL